ncbi:MAG: hypothetical protein VKN33_03100 [Candidatus Sericytochromatia bacterium]|nr:hypothetical protein [Candidatus Sericytochromatia bacterium]
MQPQFPIFCRAAVLRRLTPFVSDGVRLGVAFAFLTAFGCDEIPVGVSGGPKLPASVAPSAVPSGEESVPPDENASGAIESDPVATPTPATDEPVAEPEATEPVAPTPAPLRITPAPTGTPIPGVRLSFLSPTRESDFSQDALNIVTRVDITNGANLAVEEVTVFYNGVPLDTQEGGTEPEFTIENWNPHVVKNFEGLEDADDTPLRFGRQTLRMEVRLATGDRQSLEFSFEKPVRFASPAWVGMNAYPENNPSVRLAFPQLTPGRAFHGLVGHLMPTPERAALKNAVLFSWFGESDTPGDLDGLFRLDLNETTPGLNRWKQFPDTNVTYRRRAGLAAFGDLLYLVGGEVRSGPGLVSTNDVLLFQPNEATLDPLDPNVPDLPARLVDAAVTIHDGFLYAAGGYEDTDVATTQSTLYRLALNKTTGQVSGAAWTRMADIPNNAGRSGARLVGLNNSLYLVGGVLRSGRRDNTILRYDVAGNRWEQVAKGYPENVSHPMVAALGGKLWIFGGDASSVTESRVVGLAGRIDPETNTYEAFPAANLPAGLERAGAGIAVVDNYIYMVGGYRYSGLNTPVYLTDVIRADTL